MSSFQSYWYICVFVCVCMCASVYDVLQAALYSLGVIIGHGLWFRHPPTLTKSHYMHYIFLKVCEILYA